MLLQQPPNVQLAGGQKSATTGLLSNATRPFNPHRSLDRKCCFCCRCCLICCFYCHCCLKKTPFGLFKTTGTTETTYNGLTTVLGLPPLPTILRRVSPLTSPDNGRRCSRTSGRTKTLYKNFTTHPAAFPSAGVLGCGRGSAGKTACGGRKGVSPRRPRGRNRVPRARARRFR